MASITAKHAGRYNHLTGEWYGKGGNVIPATNLDEFDRLPDGLRERILANIGFREGDELVVRQYVDSDEIRFTNRTRGAHYGMSLRLFHEDVARMRRSTIKPAYYELSEETIERIYKKMNALTDGARVPNRATTNLPKYIAVDWAKSEDEDIYEKYFHPSVEFKAVDEKKEGGVILLISHHIDEAQEFATEVLGVRRDQWHWVIDFKDMMKYRGSSTYLLPTARMRADFEAIQGLFIQCKASVIDLDSDE